MSRKIFSAACQLGLCLRVLWLITGAMAITPVQAATVYFQAASTSAQAIPLWPWVATLVLSAMLLWFGGRAALLARRHAVASVFMLCALALASLLIVQPGRATSPQLIVEPDNPACRGGAGQLDFDPYVEGLTLYNGCANTPLQVTGHDLECAAIARREGELPDGARLGPGEALAVSHCDVDVNEPPIFTVARAEITVAEDAGPQSFPGLVGGVSPGPSHEAAQTVSLAVTSDQPALFSAGPALASNGELTFTTAPDAFGGTELRIVATDSDGALGEQALMLQVTPVNDAPSFAAVTSLSVDEDGGQDLDTDNVAFSDTRVTLPGAVTAMSPGNSWEHNTGETVRFEVEYVSGEYQRDGNVACVAPTSMPAEWFFAIPPGGELSDAVQVLADGALQVLLGADKWGRVVLRLTAVDQHGARSAPRTLRMNIDPVFDAPPVAATVNVVGDENTSIPVSLPGSTFRDITRRHFIIRSFSLDGGKSGTLTQGGVAVQLDRLYTSSEFSFTPATSQYSDFNFTTGLFDIFATFTYQVWSGEGDANTGESEPLGASGQFLELSPVYTGNIVVNPVF